MSSFRDQIEERNQALRELNIPFIKEWAGCADDAVALITAHKARYEVTSIEDSYRHESREWLESRGYSRFSNLEWPPKGELPSGVNAN